MTKKTYMQPAIKVGETEMEEQLLTASVAQVSTEGLDDDDDEFQYGDGGKTTGSVWDEAW